MSRILVIGYGNPLRADDAIGWHAVEALEERFPEYTDIRFIVAHQLLPEHIVSIAESDYVVFVDASKTGNPGDISHVNVSPADSTLSMMHALSPGYLLTYVNEYYEEAPDAVLFTLTGADFGLREGLSNTVQSNLPQFVDVITEFIDTRFYVSDNLVSDFGS